MLKYNLCLIRQGSKILLLNRESPTWMGCWNGVGGKLERGEDPRTSMLREIYEETNIKTFIKQVDAVYIEMLMKDVTSWDLCDHICKNLIVKLPIYEQYIFDWSVDSRIYYKRA